ncbi:alpha/beta fold hydrolase [Nakamurella alba]|nr:alpha/beta hydrolase [Nakamurella alba]
MTTAQITSTVTSTDGTAIALETHGPAGAPTVIGVHGATAYRGILNTAGDLADATGLRTISYDRRGRGESGDTLPYAVEREIEDIAAIVDLAPEGAWLLGESSGAVLALEAALAGVPVRGVIAYEPPFVVDAGRPSVPADYVQRIDAHIAAGRRLDAFKQFSLEGVGMPAEMVEGIAEGPWWPLVEPVAHTLAYDGRIMRDTMRGSASPLARYAAVPVPVLVLAGAESWPFVHSAAQALAAVLPAGELELLPGADHQLQPATVAGPIAAFVARTAR